MLVFLPFYGFSCFPPNEAPIYVGKHMLKLAKALTVKMTPCIDQWHAQFCLYGEKIRGRYGQYWCQAIQIGGKGRINILLAYVHIF